MANWFEVDKSGLKALQEGKSKTFIVRELLQNAFDENITTCRLEMKWEKYGEVWISVEDDSPEGFRDLSDAYTLFKDTYKRADATKRGRFNLGEKQVFSVCDYAKIETTTGTIEFGEYGRHQGRLKRESGSKVTVQLRLKREEFDELKSFVELVLVPKHIDFHFKFEYDGGIKSGKVGNGEGGKFYYYKEPYKVFEATLRTELKDGDAFRPTRRKTTVHVHRTEGPKYLYELGIPVCEIDCDFSIDVQQKVPLSTDRDTVSAAFLKELYALVLNHTHETITSENAANAWVREGASSPLVKKEAVLSVVYGRFGNKVVVANPTDPTANDDAIASGYHVLRGSELNKDEWDSIRKFSAIQSSTQVFSRGKAEAVSVQPSQEQKRVGEWAKKFFKEFFNTSLKVEFMSSPMATTIADFELNGSCIRFNVSKIMVPWTEGGRPSKEIINLIIHEFGHRKGMHTQNSYHEALTSMGAWLTVKALENPEWFRL